MYASKHSKDPLAIWRKTMHVFPFNLSPALQQYLFTFILNLSVPYLSTSFRFNVFRVTLLEPGLCRGQITEYNGLRNPFRCIHACALGLLGETVGGLAVFTRLKPKDRAIVTSLNCDYYKKSRGVVQARCSFERPAVQASGETVKVDEKDKIKRATIDSDCVVTLTDSQGDIVAKVTARWTFQLVVSEN